MVLRDLGERMARKSIQLDKFNRRSFTLSLGIFVFDTVFYCSLGIAISLVESNLLKLFLAMAFGLFSGLLFIVGHDACHRAFSPSKRLDEFIGRIAFLPTFTAFSLWEIGHNRLHHIYTNLATHDYAYRPLDLQEYSSKSFVDRLWYRAGRSFIGVGLHHMREIWWKHMIFPSQRAVPERMRIHFLDSLLCVLWAATLFVFGYFFSQSAISTLIFLFLIPQAFWLWLVGFVEYQQHTHPSIPWYARFEDWARDRDRIVTSPHITFPPIIGLLFHDVMEHTAHHLNPTIPMYQLRAAQKEVDLGAWPKLIVESGSLRAFMQKTRICKLYDFDKHEWLDFRGNTTAKVPNHV